MAILFSSRILSLLLLCILCGGLILTAGCVQSTAPQDIKSAPAAGQANPPPETIRADMQAPIDEGINKTGVPGTQIEVAAPDWTWNSAAGNASLSPAVPATPGMRFIIASVTKTFTSVAVLKLAEEGKLSLDDTIDRWLPADVSQKIENSSVITVRQLLDHTSGIPDYDEMAMVLQEYESPDTPVPYQHGMWDAIDAGPLYPPGGGYTYSNVNYILLTLIIDRAAGVPFEDYVTRKIFVPSGMNDTFVHRTNHITGPHMRALEPGEDGAILDFTDLYVQFDRGAGDIVSTVSDLNRFHRALVDGQIITPASYSAMQTITAASTTARGDETSGYGLGYIRRDVPSMNATFYGHTGGYPGAATFWFCWKEKDTMIAMNVNSAANAAAAQEQIFMPVCRYLENRI